jgi:hypothetical protein
MKSIHRFYTKTLGDLYFDQGFTDDAEMVFRHLLQNDPENDVYKSKLNEIKSIRYSKKHDVTELVRSWARLLLEEKIRKSESWGGSEP